jgi:hypothetical protein
MIKSTIIKKYVKGNMTKRRANLISIVEKKLPLAFDVIEIKTISFIKKLFHATRKKGNQYYKLFIFFTFSNSLIINYLYDSANANRRLFLQLNLIFIATLIVLTSFIELRINNYVNRSLVIKSVNNTFNLISILAILSISLYITLKSFQYYRLDGRGLEYLIATTVLLSFYLLAFILLCVKNIDAGEEDFARNLIYFIVGATSILSLSTTRTYEYFVNYSINTKILFYIWAIFGFYTLVKYKRISEITNLQFGNRIKSSILLIFYTILVLVLSFRSDYIVSITGSSFHWSYFTGVIKTIRSGGHLLVDTPSQYGFLNVLIPSLIPLDDPRSSFYIFQSLLLVIFCLIYFIVISKSTLFLTNKVFWIIIPTLLIFFADPVLIGPQLYPSSSVVRFLPSTLTAMYLIRREPKLQLALNDLIKITFILIINLLWSGESFLYSAFIIFAYFAFNIMAQNIEANLFLKFKSLLYLYVKVLIIFLIMICISSATYKMIYNLWPDYRLLFFYPTKYARGFGSTELIYNAPFWFPVVISLFLFLLVMRVKTYKDKNSVFIGGSIIIIWLSYYFGRSVADNIIAIYPLIVVILIVAISNLNNFKPFIEFRVLMSLFATFTFLWGISSVLSPNLAKTFGQFQTFSSLPIEDPIKAPDNMSQDLEILSRKYDSPPISFFGQGNLPFIDKDRFPSVNVNQTFIPSPIGLLEAPLNTEERLVFLRKFYENVDVSGGLLVMDNWNFPDRAEQWIVDLDNFFRCEKIIDRENYKILYCKK